MERFLRILGRAGLAILITAVGMALSYALGILNPSRAFAPVQAAPLLIAVFFVTTRMGAAYGLLSSLAPPLLTIVLQGIDPDPTNTPFILAVILLFELLFLFIVSRILRLFVKNGALLGAASYIAGIALTFLVLKYGLFPFLPLMSLPTILWNFLFGSVWYALLGFLLFEAAGIALFRLKARLLWEVK